MIASLVNKYGKALWLTAAFLLLLLLITNDGLTSTKRLNNSQLAETTKPSEQKSTSEKQKPEKSKETTEAKNKDTMTVAAAGAIQFCQGKYKKGSAEGEEIITVRCPNVEDKCSCGVADNSLTEWVTCGGKKKSASKGSNITSCDSIIIGGD